MLLTYLEHIISKKKPTRAQAIEEKMQRPCRLA